MYRARKLRRSVRRIPRPVSSGATGLYIVRSGTPTAVTITNGGVHSSYQPKLSDCVTSDLEAVFNEYKLVKCVVRWTLRKDPSSANSAGYQVYQIALANDPEGITPSAFNQTTAYANHRRGYLQSGQDFKYTFVPKATGAVGISGTATAVTTFRQNPWIYLNATGITVPHSQMNYSIMSTDTTAATIQAEYCIDYHFMVKGIS